MTNNIPQICAAFEIWQDDDRIRGSTTLEIIMRYLADDPEIDVVLSDDDRARAYRDYIGRQNENLNTKTLIIRELNKDRAKDKIAIETLKSDYGIMRTNHSNVVAKLQDDIKVLEAELSAREERIHKSQVINDNRVMVIERLKEEIDSLDTELYARKEDSAVLMKVVEIIKEWGNATSDLSSYTRQANATALRQIATAVENHLDAQEGPAETPIDDLYTTTISVMLEMP